MNYSVIILYKFLFFIVLLHQAMFMMLRRACTDTSDRATLVAKSPPWLFLPSTNIKSERDHVKSPVVS